MQTLKFSAVLLLILFSGIAISAQTKKIKKADDTFNAGEYYKASEMYTKLYSKANSKLIKGELAFKLGECYRKLNEPKKAEKWYQRAVNAKYQDPMSVCYLADAMKMNEKYADAIVEYELFKDLVPDDPRGKDGVQSCEMALKWINNPDRYMVENMKELNSKQSDFRPEFFKDNTVLYFTSSREGGTGNNFNNNSGQNFADIFFTTKDRKGKWSEPIPAMGDMNSQYDEGACSINSKGTELYFTSCKAVKGEVGGCQIYKATYTGTGWSQVELVPLVEDSAVSVGHPAISSDELTLYFVTDMTGGAGGKDIWKATRASKSQKWGKPVNLGLPVNTAGDEMYPYIREDGVLYFSSNAHLGLGGLDIFRLDKDESGRPLIVNMKPPINSPSDDFGIIFDGKEETGYFSSTRAGGKGNDDIYSFDLPALVFTLKGTVRNDATDEIISEALVKLEGSDGTSLETNSGTDGGFKFRIKPETDYVVTTSKTGFLKGKANESTKGLTKSTDIAIEIFMAPVTAVIEVQNIFYDFNRWELRPESMVALDKLVETLNLNSNITIELSSHTDFRGSDQDNMILSQKRAQSVVDYLVSKGITPERLVAKGYGESQPRVISKKLGDKYDFLKDGDVLTEDFINKLPTNEQKEIAHQINRRTEFKVIRTDYDESGIKFGQ
ncbi:MAG: OmpA family protein [Bacteroidales bacterium]